MPSIELAFLTQDDVSDGPPALYLTKEYTQDVEPLYLRESGGRSNPFSLDPFSGDYSGFNVGADGMNGGRVAGATGRMSVGTEQIFRTSALIRHQTYQLLDN